MRTEFNSVQSKSKTVITDVKVFVFNDVNVVSYGCAFAIGIQYTISKVLTRNDKMNCVGVWKKKRLSNRTNKTG